MHPLLFLTAIIELLFNDINIVSKAKSIAVRRNDSRSLIMVLSILGTLSKSTNMIVLAYTLSSVLPPNRVFFLIQYESHTLVLFITILESYLRLRGRPVGIDTVYLSELLFYFGVLFVRHQNLIWLLLTFYSLFRIIFAYNEWGYLHIYTTLIKFWVFVFLALFG